MPIIEPNNCGSGTRTNPIVISQNATNIKTKVKNAINNNPNFPKETSLGYLYVNSSNKILSSERKALAVYVVPVILSTPTFNIPLGEVTQVLFTRIEPVNCCLYTSKQTFWSSLSISVKVKVNWFVLLLNSKYLSIPFKLKKSAATASSIFIWNVIVFSYIFVSSDVSLLIVPKGYSTINW